MKIRDYEGSEDFTANTGLYAEIGEYEHVTVRLPSSHVVTVYAGLISVRDPAQDRHQDGQQIWTVHAGTVPLEPCPECGRAVGRTRAGRVRRHGTVAVSQRSGLRSYPTCQGSGTVLAD